MEHKIERVLIVEDEIVNRKILKKIVAGDGYSVVEASNGKEALQMLEKYSGKFCTILLDIFMPVMDGYEFLDNIKETKYKDLPIVVMTSEQDSETEKKALDKGAWDFVTKPYRPAILLTRLKNAVIRSQIKYLIQMKHMAEHDTITDLYNRTHFFDVTKRMIFENDNQRYALVRVDVDKFRVLNSFWGENGGNDFLKYIANAIKKLISGCKECTYGRIESDIFCMCIPFADKKKLNEELVKFIEEISAYSKNFLIHPSIGIYEIDDKDIAIDRMYIMASLASKQNKNQYNQFISYYTDDLSKEMIREQIIINEMEQALQEGQFEVYLQPKYNLQTRRPYGAEALVRWKHPNKGMISPGVFIPVFEKNGFIGKLDLYIWEQVCILLRKWIDEGKNVSPISVNMSRADLYNPQLVDIMNDLMKKYSLSHDLLNLELTESMYMDDPMAMSKVINDLRKSGFKIMMDDFGSGYSSLNTLKDIMVDYLKIDMKFLTNTDNDTRSKRVLASMIRMAEWLELPVIVEGVETREQCNFLESIGCGYIQGYYFAKPMPVSDYEELVRDINEIPYISNADINSEVIDAIWSSDLKKDFLFSNCPQAFAIFEIDNVKLGVIRGNKEFAKWFGYADICSIGFEAFEDNIDSESLKKINEALKKAVDTKEVVICDYFRKYDNAENDVCEVRMCIRYIGRTDTSYLIMGTFTPLTDNK